DLAAIDGGERVGQRAPLEAEVLVLVRPEAFVGVGGGQLGREIEVHQLAREAGRRPEGRQPLPSTGAIPGLLFELAPGGEVRILDPARGLVDVERPGQISSRTRWAGVRHWRTSRIAP